MREAYLLLERFGSALGSARAVRHVANQLGGMCARFAIQARYQGNIEAAKQHLEIARAHGCGVIGMALALARIAAVRSLLRVFAVRFLPDGFARTRENRDGIATTASARVPRGTRAPGGATGA